MAYLSRCPCGYVVSRHGTDKWNTTDLSRRSPSCRLRYRRGHATGTLLSNVHHTLSCASLLSGCPFRSGCSRDASSLPNSHVLVGHGFIIIDRTHFINGLTPRRGAAVPCFSENPEGRKHLARFLSDDCQ